MSEAAGCSTLSSVFASRLARLVHIPYLRTLSPRRPPHPRSSKPCPPHFRPLSPPALQRQPPVLPLRLRPPPRSRAFPPACSRGGGKTCRRHNDAICTVCWRHKGATAVSSRVDDGCQPSHAAQLGPSCKDKQTTPSPPPPTSSLSTPPRPPPPPPLPRPPFPRLPPWRLPSRAGATRRSSTPGARAARTTSPRA